MSNHLKEDMVFQNNKEVAKFLNYTDSEKGLYIERYLSHFCKFHKDKKYKIFIDEVYDNPIPFKVTKFIYDIGDRFDTKNGSFEIINMYMTTRTDNHRYRVYLCRCLNDNYEFERTHSEIKRGCGCPVCGKSITALGYNTIYDLRTDLIQYFVNPEDAKKYTEYANDAQILCKCPVCDKEQYMTIPTLSRYGFSCKYCGDGISYPNKYIRSFLSQLKLDFIPEKTFNWSGRKLYDQYIPSYKMIIENHGMQHYFNNFGRDEKANDEIKKKLALDNGIEHYIEIDCRYSEADYIKESIMKSELPKILNFKESDIDWSKCDLEGQNDIMQIVWDMWNSNKHIYEIEEATGLWQSTINRYVRKGDILGKINYKDRTKDPSFRSNCGISSIRPIICEDTNMIFRSSKDAVKYYMEHDGEKYIDSSIGRSAIHGIPYKKKHYKYITKKEFNELKKQSLSDKSLIVIGDFFEERFINIEQEKQSVA